MQLFLLLFFLGANAVLIGSWLMVRQQTMLADAMSHAVFPGIVCAFIATHSKASFWMFLGALLAGTAALLLIHFLQETIGLRKQEAIGFILSSFFAFGLLLAAVYGDRVDLDLDCVFSGQILLEALNPSSAALYRLGLLLILNITLHKLFYPYWLLVSFDPDYGHVIGISSASWSYLLMGLVALNLTCFFGSVGVLLPAGFLIVSTASARLRTQFFSDLLLSNAVITAAVFQLAFLYAYVTDASLEGSVICLGGLFFIWTFLFHNPKK